MVIVFYTTGSKKADVQAPFGPRATYLQVLRVCFPHQDRPPQQTLHM